MKQNTLEKLKQDHRARTMVIGWREYAGLPELGLEKIHAKIDTGARTSALHAENIRHITVDGAAWAEFEISAFPGAEPKTVRLPIKDERSIRNTGGVPELRTIVRTKLVLAGRRWRIDLSLADRQEMRHPIILGRTAIRGHGLLVDCGKSYLTSKSDDYETSRRRS